MTGGSSATRLVVVMLAVAILFEAGAVSPALTFATEPSPSPSSEQSSPAPSAEPLSSPEASPEPAPSAEPSSGPSPSPEPSPEPAAQEPPGVERIDLRTANSRTFAQADGSLVSEFYSAPLFYQPDGSTEWQPIDLRFAAVAGSGADAQVEHSPARLSLFAADAPGGFLALEGGGHAIRFLLPPGVSAGAAGARAQISPDGRFADYADFLPAGIGLRVFPRSDGFKSFLVLPARPLVNTFTLAVDAPGLVLAAEPDGTLAFRDGEGNVVGRIPRPFMVDSW